MGFFDSDNMSELKIEYIPLSDIKPYEHNAKKHPNSQIEKLMRSIELTKGLPVGIVRQGVSAHRS